MVKSFAQALQKVLEKSIPHDTSPVLFKYSTPEKKFAEAAKAEKLEKSKNAERVKRKLKCYSSSTDVVIERTLKKAALKGVVRLFNELSAKQVSFEKQKKMKNAKKLCKT